MGHRLPESAAEHLLAEDPRRLARVAPDAARLGLPRSNVLDEVGLLNEGATHAHEVYDATVDVGLHRSPGTEAVDEG